MDPAAPTKKPDSPAAARDPISVLMWKVAFTFTAAVTMFTRDDLTRWVQAVLDVQSSPTWNANHLVDLVYATAVLLYKMFLGGYSSWVLLTRLRRWVRARIHTSATMLIGSHLGPRRFEWRSAEEGCVP